MFILSRGQWLWILMLIILPIIHSFGHNVARSGYILQDDPGRECGEVRYYILAVISTTEMKFLSLEENKSSNQLYIIQTISSLYTCNVCLKSCHQTPVYGGTWVTHG